MRRHDLDMATPADDTDAAPMLTDCKPGDRVRIVAIDAGHGAVLNLMHLGLDLGLAVELRRRSVLGGPVVVNHAGSDIAIGRGLASKIRVRPL